jgi:regulator of sigma E protease
VPGAFFEGPLQAILRLMYYLVGIILLLGILIFIHEFGHFYIAKICGMKVETFSIGMGHKILTFKRGETEYALSWMPFGGYVKIMGQDPREEVPENEKHRSFSLMPLWKRYAVVIAGPAANFILAFFVFWALFAKGFPSPSATVHFVHPNTPAAVANLQAGDKIIAIESQNRTGDIRELADLQRFLRLEPNASTLKITVERAGQEQILNVESKQGKFIDPMTGLERESVTLPGADFQSYPALFSALSGSLVTEKIKEDFFIVTSFKMTGTETEVNSLYQLESAWLQAQQQNTSLLLSIRAIKLQESSVVDEAVEIEVTPPQGSTLSSYGFAPAHLLVTQILEDSAATKLGLQSGDIITELNNEPMWTFAQFRRRLQEVAEGQETLHLKWLRSGKVQEGHFTPQYVDQENPITQKKEQRFQLGAMFVGFSESSFEKVKAKGFFDGIYLAAQKTWGMSVAILDSFGLLFSGQVSVKAMGGPVMIGKIAGDSLKLGADYFLKMLAFISLNLAILNLMPLPVLDGGHIVLFTLEGIIRRPIPVKIIEIWAMTGFFLLISLALFVTFNDLTKLNFFAPILRLFGQ